MKLGLIGLGRMGKNLALNAIDKGHELVVFNRTVEKALEMEKDGAVPTRTVEELVEKLEKPRVVWLMIPQGKPVEDMIQKLENLLDEGDIIIDGGNSYFKDSIRRAEKLKEKNLKFLDIGTSGGIEGARNGACMMAGGDKEAFELVEQFVKSVCVENGYDYFGKPGSGHFVKMIHNGIEYGMMQAIGEGYEILEASPFDIDYKKVSKVWNNGSVIRSWLVELIGNAFSKEEKLETIPNNIGQNGEGLWSIHTAMEYKVPTPTMTAAVNTRFRSNQEKPFSEKIVQALRKEFGGHDTKTNL